MVDLLTQIAFCLAIGALVYSVLVAFFALAEILIFELGEHDDFHD